MAKRKQAQRNPQAKPLVLPIFLGGILAGSLVTGAVIIKMGHPQTNAVQDVSAKNTTADAVPAKKSDPSDQNTKTTKKAKYDFYTILPEMEVAVPNTKTSPEKAQTQVLQAKSELPLPPIASRETTTLDPSIATIKPLAAKPPIEEKHNIESYYLQLAAFKKMQDADQLKAELTLNGFNVDIQSVTVNNQQWHRVRVGPFQNEHLAKESQRQLEGKYASKLVTAG